MFDTVPVRVWLLIAIAAAAYAPALYLYRHVAHSPSRRDITQPSEDLSWRTSSQLARNLLILTALVALAIFIFTPAATQFAHSPSFWPILIAAVGTWALFTVPKGLTTGRIKPIIRGFYKTYQRQTEPKRFWASIGWNTFFGCLCLWLAFESIEQSVQDRCYNERYTSSPQEMLSACNQLIDRLQPDSFEAYYNRGLAYQRVADSQHAIADFTAAIRLRPNDANAYFMRGYEYKVIGDFQHIISDFSEVIRLVPDNAEAYYYRGAAYEELGNEEQAASDFAAATRLNPKLPNPYS